MHLKPRRLCVQGRHRTRWVHVARDHTNHRARRGTPAPPAPEQLEGGFVRTARVVGDDGRWPAATSGALAEPGRPVTRSILRTALYIVDNSSRCMHHYHIVRTRIARSLLS